MKSRSFQPQDPPPGSPSAAERRGLRERPGHGEPVQADARRPGPPPAEGERIALSESAWRNRLGDAEFRVLRKEATEPAFTSPLNAEHRHGVFVCAGCGADLFRSESKYDSGTGWPSFYDALPGAVETRRDFRLIVPRTEYHCARCGGHQGHVFGDGPAPTGLRYCNNGVALRFRPTEEDGAATERPAPGTEAGPR